MTQRMLDAIPLPEDEIVTVLHDDDKFPEDRDQPNNPASAGTVQHGIVDLSAKDYLAKTRSYRTIRTRQVIRTVLAKIHRHFKG
jgi:hypothetical protein